MADPTRLKRELARLADDPTNADAVIDEAARAVEDLDTATTFVETVGLARLRAAVRTADRRGDGNLARRGQRALAAFEWVRQAADTTSSGPETRRDGSA